MTRIHDLSCTAMLGQFESFSLPATQESVKESLEQEYRPTSNLHNCQYIEFDFIAQKDEYVMFSETTLDIRTRITLSKDKPSDADWQTVKPVNNFLHSLFKSVELTANGKELTRFPQSYAYRAYYEVMFGYTSDSKNSYLSSIGWIDSEAQRQEMFKPIDVDLSKGAEVDFKGKLHLDLSFQGRAFIGGVSYKLKLVLNPVEFLVECGVGLGPKVEILDATLFVHKFKVTQKLLDAQTKALNQAAAKIPFTRIEVKSVNVAKGVLDAMIDNLCLGQLPRRILVSCIHNTAFNGSLSKNPFYFHHFNLSFIACYVDGVQYPTKAYQPNYKRKLYNREYEGLFKALNQNMSDSTINLNRFDYIKGNTVYGFNFAPDLSNGFGCEGHLNPIKRGSLRIQMQFREPLPDTINVLVYCEYDNLIQIDRDRNITTDYN